jgi:AcrR family transcriptional regulator
MPEEDDRDRSRAAAQRALDELAEARRDALAAVADRRREAISTARERRETIASGRQRPSERRRTASRGPRTALTLEAILAEATRILDADGIEGLTLRRLAKELGVGAASVYWYVDDKDELLQLAYEATAGPTVRRLQDRPIDADHWREALRSASIELFELIEAHPWIAEMMGVLPRSPMLMVLWDRIGQLLTAVGLGDEMAFYAGSALMGLLGAAGLSAIRDAHSDEDRDVRLGRGAGELAALDPVEFPFVARTISTYRRHSEREQFLGGLDLVLDGIQVRVDEAQQS